MDTGRVIAICFAIPVAVCLAVRECRWRARLRCWEKSEGRIVEYADDTGADIDCPIVGYRFQGREMRQACEFNLRHHELGHVVPILIHPESGEIFITASHDRWTLSGVLLGCLVFLGLLAALSN